MRKSAILTLVVLVLSVGGVCIAASDIYDTSDQVEYSETIIYGDKSEAEGASVQILNAYAGQLFWDTIYKVKEEPEVETKYSFSLAEVYEEDEGEYSGIRLEAYPDTNFEAGKPATGIDVAFAELHDEVEANEEGYKNVLLKEYYDYYPLQIYLQFPGMYLSSLDVTHGYVKVDEAYQKAMDSIEAYFKIPVLDTQEHQIMLQKDETGFVVGQGIGESDHGDKFYMIMESALSDDACYFVVDAHTAQGEIVDLSELPDGFGIFKLPYETKTKGDVTTTMVDATSLDMVYEINPEIGIYTLDIDKADSELLLYTEEENELILTVIDIATMAVKQRLELPEWTALETYWHPRYANDCDTIILVGGEHLAVIDTAENGQYELDYICDRASEKYDDYEIWASDYAYNGQKLAYVAGEQNDNGTYNGNFILSVYDKTGITYLGEYNTSLDTGHMAEVYGYSCGTYKEEAIFIEWDK